MTNAHAIYNEMQRTVNYRKSLNDSTKISTTEKLQNKDKITIKQYTQLIDVSK